MKQIYFLVNRKEEFDFLGLAKRYLKGYKIVFGIRLPADISRYALVIPWAYQRIIRPLPQGANKIIVFHSSDLPRGKGWAPIYNAIIRRQKCYTISGILASGEVDGGDIVVKARFRLKGNYTAPQIRKWDVAVSLFLARLILDKFKNKQIKGRPQTGRSSYYRKRNLNDNQVNAESRLCEIVDHLRACENRSPAYFKRGKYTFYLHLEPLPAPHFPNDIQVKFYDESKWRKIKINYEED